MDLLLVDFMQLNYVDTLNRIPPDLPIEQQVKDRFSCLNIATQLKPLL